MTKTEERLAQLWDTRDDVVGWLSTVDHKTIGKRYLVTAFAFLVVAGLEALFIRLQLARPEQRLVTPETYDQVFTMHGVTMIFWYASPILSGFSNYLVPLMIGARDMALPRLNAFTYWVFLLSGVFLYSSVVMRQSPHGGWFAYVPYTSERYSPGAGMDFYAVSLLFLTVSTTAGAINAILTILRHRAIGMTLTRMPLFMYSTLTTSCTILFSLPALTVACVFLELDRRWHFHFFDTRQGGSALLWQQLFWFFGHPWVYVVFLPATGMISMILPVFARRPIVGYPYVATATVLTGVVGFGVWIHHMFAVGISHLSLSFFSAASMTISLFTTVQVFAWVATLWLGRPVLKTSMLFVLGFLVSLVIGGLSGVVTAVVPFDWQVHDTYFVVAHLHYVLVGANVFPVFAALYYWFPKMTGRVCDERLGTVSFWLMIVGFNVTFFPMHIAGILGMRRRVFTFAAGQGLEGWNLASSLGAAILGMGILVSVWNFVRAASSRVKAAEDPWKADTLEWLVPSPPPSYGSTYLPTVVTRHPLWDAHDEGAATAPERIFDQGRLTLTTTWLDAQPLSLAKMPEDTAMPLMAALALTAVCAGVMLRSLPAMLGAAAATALVAALWLWPEPEKEPTVPQTQVESDALVTAIDDRRGVGAMVLFICTEATLFVILFFVYFYLGPYPTDAPPKLTSPLVMLAILVASSLVLHGGEHASKRGRDALARGAIVVTLLLAAVFMALQVAEYRDHLRTLTPQSSAYGSIFYTVTTFHAVHLVLGALMLGYVLFLPTLGPGKKPPHRPLQSAALYWHFVDVVWIAVVGVLYVLPNVGRG